MHPRRAVSYWDGFATSYNDLGPPLRPSEEEVGSMEGIVREWALSQGIRSPQALLLGVTPAIASMRWPPATSLMAIDKSFPMARIVWPGDIPGERTMVCGDWLALPRRETSCDLVVGDGSINCLSYPDGFCALAEAAAGVLRGNGLLVLRSYLQAASRESPEQVYQNALDGSIGSFQAFKLRLLMALQHTAQEGIAVNDAYQWVCRDVDLPALARRTGWTKPAVETIERYKGCTTVYSFPSLEELRSALLPRFEELSLLIPGHEMGPRCPICVFTVRKPALR
jgi:hypothetical protein